MINHHPIFSRCSLGNGRWFWLVYRSWEALLDGEKPLATGYAATAQEAEQVARNTAPGAEYYGANTASNYHRKLCNQRRAAKPPSKKTGTMAQDFLYSDWQSDYDDYLDSTQHLIVKKTKKLIFVETNDYHPDPWERETYALNRAELEETGSTWSASARKIFHTTPYEQRRQQWIPPDLAVLEVTAGASKEEVKAVYRRLAKKHHPDCGGDPDKFKEIQNAYERAMKR